MNGPNQTLGRTRQFVLPRIDELTKDQEDALSLQMNGQYLVIGGPGTGKSVVALLRAHRCAREEVPYVFLIYNRLLQQACRLLSPGVNAFTWEGWFREIITKRTGNKCPLMPAKSPGAYQEIDWEQIAHLEFSDPGTNGTLPQVIIDEGQDMPPEFFKVLGRLGYEDFFVVADQNQQIITGKCSSRWDLESALAIDTEKVKELKENHRNTLQIARLARRFYTGDPSSPPPDLPPAGKSAIVPRLFNYDPTCLPDIFVRILMYWDRRPGLLIGIITPKNEVRSRYVHGLRECGVTLSHPKPYIQTYASGDGEDLGFDQGGIMVINVQSCKGLEFDVVFIADVDCFYPRPDDEDFLKRRFYVMVARARRSLFMLRQAGKHCPVDLILPTEPEILEYHGL